MHAAYHRGMSDGEALIEAAGQAMAKVAGDIREAQPKVADAVRASRSTGRQPPQEARGASISKGLLVKPHGFHSSR